MVLGTAEQIQEKIKQTLGLIKEEKNNDVRLALYNYIGNLYSALSTVKGRKVYPNKKRIFGENFVNGFPMRFLDIAFFRVYNN